jgi:hypothetical protein
MVKTQAQTHATAGGFAQRITQLLDYVITRLRDYVITCQCHYATDLQC